MMSALRLSPALVLAACAAAPSSTSAVIEPAPVEPTESAPRFREAYELTKTEDERARALDVHLGERWFEVRAEQLGIGVDEARARDAAMSAKQAPAIFWDEQTAIETASVWTALCNECHGGRRRLTDVRKMPPPPASWGASSGYFFGQPRRHEDMFRMIAKGGEVVNGTESDMPAWEGRLSHELTWALVYFIEYQSGGVEGNFPPSLYPATEAQDD